MLSFQTTGGQTVLVQDVDTTRLCGECSIQVTRVATLAVPATDGEVSETLYQILQDSKGRIYGISGRSRELVQFSSPGRDVRSIQLGESGSQRIRFITRVFLDASDSLVVIDEGRQEVLLLGPEREPARSFPLSVTLSHWSTSLRLPDGDFLLGGMVPTGGRVGYPLQLLSPSGSIIQSFGAEVPRYSRANEAATVRKVASYGGEVWTVRPDRYELEAWDPSSNALVRTLRRNPQWFPPRDRSISGLSWGEYRPESWIQDLSFDAEGNLWVVVRTARDDWKMGAKEFEWARMRDDYQTVIEVIDVGSGRMLATASIPEHVNGFAGEGLIQSHRGGPDGRLVYDIWSLDLVR